MKRPLFVVVLFSAFVISPAVAQEVVKQKEAGILFLDFDNFGLTYRWGNANALWRLSAVSFSISNADVLENERTDLSLGFSVGREYRKSLDAKIQFRYGFELGGGYSMEHEERSTGEKVDSKGYLIQPGAILGVNYNFSDRLILGFEILPGFSYYDSEQTVEYQGNTTTDDTNRLQFGFSSQPALLSLVYRW